MNRTIKTKIVPFERKVGYLEACRLVKERGMKIASNAAHDAYLDKTRFIPTLNEIITGVRMKDEERTPGKFCKMVHGLYPAWAREVIVHPEKDGIFVGEKDIVDPETGWTLPATCIPPQAIGRKKMGLFVDPENIAEENGRIVVHPASVVVLRGLVQISGDKGKMHKTTGMPLEAPAEDLYRLFYLEKTRTLLRKDCIGVRPIARKVYFYNWGLGMVLYVISSYMPTEELGVAAFI